MKENTDQTAASLLSPTVCDPPAIQGGLYSPDPEVNINPPPDTVPTRQASTEHPNQMGVDIARSPIGTEVVCLSGTVGDTTDRPDNDSTKKDSELQKSKNHLAQPRQKSRSKTALPSHNIPEQSLPPRTTGGRQQLPGHAAQDLEGLCPDTDSGTLGCTEVHHTTSSTTTLQRQEQLLASNDTRTTDTATISSDGVHTAQHGTLEPTTSETKDNEPDPTLKQRERYAITKHQRRNARNKPQAKNSTVCFALDTPILIETLGQACCKPIYRAAKGDIVVQTLPSGKIEDLTGALMTPIKTLCAFNCLNGRSDMVRMGKSNITAHYHFQTAEGWMMARQAAVKGHGDFWPNFRILRVYNLCLEGGGNILINTGQQEAMSLTTAATMGSALSRQWTPSI